MVVAPGNGVLSGLARATFRSTPLYWFLDRLLMHNNELLSYLYFDENYFNVQFAQARLDAAAVLQAGWQT
jgi:hypothetical protein